MMHDISPLWLGTLPAAGVLGLLAAYSLPKKGEFVEECERKVALLPTGRLDSILELLCDSDAAKRERLVWEKINGLNGLREYKRQMRLLVSILQGCVDKGLVSDESAAEVYEAARMQSHYTTLAFIESLTSPKTSTKRHLAGYAAMQYHWAVTHLTITLCKVTGAPACLLSPGALL